MSELWLRRLCVWGGVLLFCLAAANNIAHNYRLHPNNQIDEQAHISYAIYLIENHDRRKAVPKARPR